MGGNDEGGGPLQVDQQHRFKLPPDRELRRACPDLWKQYDAQYPDPERPLVSRVVLETVRRWSYMYAPPAAWWPERLPPLSPEDQKEKPLGYWLARASEFAQLQAEIAELLNLITPRLTLAHRREILEKAVGELPYSDAKRVLRSLKRGLAGRRADKRLLALRALEIKMLNPERTWEQIGTEVKYDTRKYHEAFAEMLPAEVRVLKRLLRKYGIRLSS